MKKIILISMILLAISSGKNPNGRPGAISIKYSHIIGEDKGHDAFKFESFEEEYNNKPLIFEMIVPVHNNLTVGFTSYPVSATLANWESNMYDVMLDDGIVQRINIPEYERSYISFYNQFTLDFQLHIPVYKLWE